MSPEPTPSVSVTEYVGADGGTSFKLQGNDWELNVRLTPHDLALVSNLQSADWEARRSICAGRAAGAAVFWAYDDEHVSLLVGQDDEAWDIAVRIPARPLAEAIGRARAKVSAR